jgi:hypothetical protein
MVAGGVGNIISPPSTHPGKVPKSLRSVFPQLVNVLIRKPPLHLNDDRPLFQVVGQSAVSRKYDRCKYRELDEFFLFVPLDPHNGRTLAMPFVHQGMKIAAVLDVLLGLIENKGWLESFDSTEQCWG